MKKYIVITDKPFQERCFVDSHSEKVIVEIISNMYFYGDSSSIVNIFEAGSKYETMVLLSSAMHFMIEIDDEREALWRDEISKIYQEEKEISKAIAEAQKVISLAENNFDRFCLTTNNFNKLKIAGFHDLDVFDEISDSAHEQISRIVKKIYKVELKMPWA
jgi:hypothetical protein